MTLSSACILPPEGDPRQVFNAPPEIDLQSLSPSASRVNVDIACNVFVVSARVRDQDDERLAFRWVANNNLIGAQCLSAPTRPNIIGAFQEEDLFISTNFFLNEVGQFTNPNAPASPSAGVLSLFVTDAFSGIGDSIEPAWNEPRCDREVRDNTDFGVLSSEGEGKSVVEVRWTLNFVNNPGDCPRERP